VGGKLTRTEAGKPQQETLNSWKSGLKSRYYFLISFFVRIEKKIKPGPLSASALGRFTSWESMSSAKLKEPVAVV